MQSFKNDSEILTWALSSDTVEHIKKARGKCQEYFKNKSGNPVFLHLIGILEFQLGNVDKASKWIKKGLQLMPDSPELLCKYAQILSAKKKFDEAIISYKRSILLKPNYAKAFYGLGNVYKECGKDDDAIKAYNEALSIEPNYPEVLNDLGVVLKNKGALEDAAKCFIRAIDLQPDYALPLNNLGFIRFSLGDMDSAEDLYRRALALKPDYPDALSNLGIILHNHGAFQESISLYKKALVLQPNHPDALNNLGTILLHQGAFEDSISLFKQTLSIQPNHSEGLNNLGNALKNIGNLSEAIDCYEKAIAINSTCPEYHNNHAMALLAAGRFEEGWQKYEWRWKTAHFATIPQTMEKPLWRGEAAEGRILLIQAEQGFGDTIQFCRYAPLAAARGLRVVLEVQPALVNLMRTVKGIDNVIAMGQPLPDFDLYCPMMSLPAAFNTRLETIPANIPYITGIDESVNYWRNRLSDGNNKKLKVGIAWAGSSRLSSPDLIAADRRRSMVPDLLAPLLDIANIQFYSLQKGSSPAPKEFGIIDFMDECNDFTDTAALITNLDLIISVDTAVAHLAGALGKPVWILNRFDSCWRWLQTREDSPWYPTLRLFRQPKPGDWKSVVWCVKNELYKFANS